MPQVSIPMEATGPPANPASRPCVTSRTRRCQSQRRELSGWRTGSCVKRWKMSMETGRASRSTAATRPDDAPRSTARTRSMAWAPANAAVLPSGVALVLHVLWTHEQDGGDAGPDDFLRHVADQHMRQAGAPVRGHDNHVGALLLCRGDDGVRGMCVDLARRHELRPPWQLPADALQVVPDVGQSAF